MPARPWTPCRSPSSDLDSGSPSGEPNCSPSAEPKQLHAELEALEIGETPNPAALEKLGRILFSRRTQTVDGVQLPYPASSQETLDCVKALLRRRDAFMKAHCLFDDGDTKYIFEDEDREAIFREWKEEYHAQPDQLELQRRDSWKWHLGKERETPADTWGPDKQAIRRGMHSRFHLHLQRVAGTKQMAEFILFTGRVDIDALRQLARGAPQPDNNLAARHDNKHLKHRVRTARYWFHKATSLQHSIAMGSARQAPLSFEQVHLLWKLRDGTLQQQLNQAVLAYGHGTLRTQDGGSSVSLGGSTGGQTRTILDHWQPPQDDDLHIFKRPRRV